MTKTLLPNAADLGLFNLKNSFNINYGKAVILGLMVVVVLT